jgi:hypothetical protein
MKAFHFRSGLYDTRAMKSHLDTLHLAISATARQKPQIIEFILYHGVAKPQLHTGYRLCDYSRRGLTRDHREGGCETKQTIDGVDEVIKRKTFAADLAFVAIALYRQ